MICPLPRTRSFEYHSNSEIGPKSKKVEFELYQFRHFPLDLQTKVYSYLSRGQFLHCVKVLSPGKVGPIILRWLEAKPKHSVSECYGLIKDMDIFLRVYGNQLTKVRSDLPFDVSQACRLVAYNGIDSTPFRYVLEVLPKIGRQLTHLELAFDFEEMHMDRDSFTVRTISFTNLIILKFNDFHGKFFERFPYVHFPNLQKLGIKTLDPPDFIKFYKLLDAPLLEKINIDFGPGANIYPKGQSPDDVLLEHVGGSPLSTRLKSLNFFGDFTDASPVLNSPFLTQLTSLKLYSLIRMEGLETFTFTALKKLGFRHWDSPYDAQLNNPLFTSLTNLKFYGPSLAQVTMVLSSDVLTNVRRLYLQGNLFLRTPDSSLTGNTHLYTIAQNIPFFIASHLQHFQPEVINLAYCHLENHHLKEVCSSSMAGLTKLDIRGNNITSLGIEYLKSLKSLKTVKLRGNPLCDEGAKALACWPGLFNYQKLDLKGCDIGDAGFKTLIESPFAKFLTRIDFFDNPLTFRSKWNVFHSPLFKTLESVCLPFENRLVIQGENDQVIYNLDVYRYNITGKEYIENCVKIFYERYHLQVAELS